MADPKHLAADRDGPLHGLRVLDLTEFEAIDVLVENYRPAVMPRAGLGFEALHEVNPRLIYAQLSGLGYDGPYAGRGGFDLIAQGMGGVMHVTGEPDGPPTSVGLPICDLGTGMWAVQGILAALYERQRTGVGRLVECFVVGDRDRLQLMDVGPVARRPRRADPPRLAPSPERPLPAHADQGRLSDGGGRRPSDLGALCGGAGAPGMVRGPAFCNQPKAHGEPRGTRSRDERSADYANHRALGRGARRSRRALRPRLQLRADVRRCATAAWSSTRATRNWARSRTSALRSGSARACGCAPSPPGLGEHNAEIFGRLGVSEAEMRELCTRGVL